MPDTLKFPVRLHHPDTGGETTAATRSSLRVLEARGWQLGTPPPDDQFDPSDHSVDEVNAHLANAAEAERQRVLDAEAAGKDRATVRTPSPDSDQS